MLDTFMSRGFVKEGDQEEPLMIPPRAALPDDTPNYVTPNGYASLLKEKEGLLKELADFNSRNDREKRRKAMEIDGKLNLLNERINTAKVLELYKDEINKVRFGAFVTYKIGNGKPITIQIVGVDEATIKERKVAFIAPIVKAIMGKKEGEKVIFNHGEEARKIEIVKVTVPTN